MPQLHDSDAWVIQAVRAAGVGIWSWDITRDQIEISESGLVLHGLTDGEVGYRAWLTTLHTDDQEPAHQAIQRTLDKKTDYSNEYRVVHPDGSVRWVSCKGRGSFDEAGNPSRLTGILFDVTAHKQAEQALKDQHLVMAHMARVSALGELSGALAHELNQPLTAILCNAQAGQRFVSQAALTEWDELSAILADIAADGLRAGNVVSRLRGLFKKGEAVQQALNINALVEEVAQLLRSDLIVKQVSLNLHLGADLPEIAGDPVQLRQVLLNLITNGAEAMAASAACPRHLRIDTRLHDAYSLEVSVRDAGPGIAPQMLEQIFEPFITSKPQGLGMGLAISRTVVAVHGGRLWAENVPGGGADFRFTLPVIAESGS